MKKWMANLNLILCVALLLKMQALAAAPSEGVWLGRIGSIPIILCSEKERVIYRYGGHKESITLDTSKPVWSEIVSGKTTGYWAFNGFSGNWKSPDQKIELEIFLDHIFLNGNACSSVEFSEDALMPIESKLFPLKLEPSVVTGLGKVNISTGEKSAIVMWSNGDNWEWNEKTLGIPVKRDFGFIKAALADYHTLGLKVDGSLWGIGSNYYGQLGGESIEDQATPLKMGEHFIDVAANNAISLAIKNDGTLWKWGGVETSLKGGRLEDRKEKPSLLGRGFVKVKAGNLIFAALKADGTLWMWGESSDGQLVYSTFYGSTSSLIRVGENFDDVAVGYGHVAALKKDGSLWVWGSNSIGQIGSQFPLQQNVPPQKIGEGFIQVVAGFDFIAALKSDGSIWALGGEESSFYGDCIKAKHGIFTKLGDGYVQLSTGEHFLLATNKDGSQWTWGWRWDNDQLGVSLPCRKATKVVYGNEKHPWFIDVKEQIKDNRKYPTNSTQISKITAGKSHSVFVKKDASVWAWGNNELGQLGNGDTANLILPTKITEGIKTAEANQNYTIIENNDGTRWRWGAKYLEQLQTETLRKNALKPIQIVNDFIQNTNSGGGSSGVISLKVDGTLWWDYPYPKQNELPVGTNVLKLINGYAIRSDGSLWQLNGLPTSRPPTQLDSQIVDVFVGERQTYSIKADGSVFAMGDVLQSNGKSSWQDFKKFGESYVSIAVGKKHALALKSDGSLWAWGINQSGAVGNNTTTDQITPVQIGKGFVQIAAGEYHSLGLKTDGTVWAWGNNEDGQLGDGTRTQRLHPVQVFPHVEPEKVSINTTIPTNIKEFGVGLYFSCAILNSGKVKCWGSNQYDQLGSKTPTSISYMPIEVPNVTDARYLRILNQGACVGQKEGADKCWGAAGTEEPVNIYLKQDDESKKLIEIPCPYVKNGQCITRCTNEKFTTLNLVDSKETTLDMEIKACKQIIQKIPTLKDAAFIVSEFSAHWALLRNGKIRSDFSEVDNVFDAVDFSIRAGSGCALEKKGDLKCWGGNMYGQLGTGKELNPQSNYAVKLIGLEN